MKSETTPPRRQNRRTKFADALLPGSHALWVGAAIAVTVGTFLLLRILFAPAPPLVGTNSVDVAALVTSAKSGDTFCIADLDVPESTQQIAVSMQVSPTGPRPSVTGTLDTGAQVIASSSRDSMPSALTYAEFKLREPVKPTPRSSASFCLRIKSAAVGFGGASVQRLPNRPVSSLNGRPIGPIDVSVRFLGSASSEPRVIDRLPDAFRRAAVFGGLVDNVLVLCALPLLLLIGYLSIRVVSAADVLRLRTLAVIAAAMSFGYATTWTVLLHPFHGPDESEHFAYAQHLAATNELPDKEAASARPPYSTSQLRLLEALHHNSTILNTTSRLRWREDWANRYEQASRGSDDSDGGGGTASATGHSPLYYLYAGVPYRILAPSLGLPDVLLAMRLWSALLASVVAACTVLLAGVMFGPGRNKVAWASGVLVGLQPVFASVSASVNNDTAVNAAAAVFLVAVVSAWRKSPTTATAVVAGLAALTLPIAKVTGFALLPILPLAVVAIATHHGVKRASRWALKLSASLALAAGFWIFVLSPILTNTPGRVYNVHTPPVAAAPAQTAETPPERSSFELLALRLRYAEQTFVPALPIGDRLWDLPGAGLTTWPAYFIYIERGYGLFGWKSAQVGPGLLKLVFFCLLAGWILAGVAAVRYRNRWRTYLSGMVLLAVSVISVLAFVSVAYTSDTIRTDAGEQGRYLFTALPALAVLFSSGLLAVKGRWRDLLTGMYVAGAAALGMLAWISALRGWFI